MENKLIRSKYFLYLTEFFAGMSVMAVELGASRLMAPYFSSSQIVWTVIIGVIMIAMAIGNVWGGKLADKSATPDKLYRRLIIAAIWIALIPFVGRYLIAGISLLLALFVTKNFLVWAALAACLVIFAFPCVLLGTVTPSLTRFTVDNLDDTGKTVGRLNALNTIGSIIGTFVPTFVTIPAVGTAATFLIFSGVLAAIGIAYFVFEKKKSVPGKTPPQKDNKKPILRISVEGPAENPQALLFAHVRKGRKQPVNCPRPRSLRSAAKNDLSIWVKLQPYMGKMRACGVPYALILAYALQKNFRNLDTVKLQ